MVITEPSVPSAWLLGLGSKPYPSNKQRMLNKNLARVKKALLVGFLEVIVMVRNVNSCFLCCYCRFAYNVTFHELNQAVIKSLLESSLHDSSLSKQDMSKNLKKVHCVS